MFCLPQTHPQACRNLRRDWVGSPPLIATSPSSLGGTPIIHTTACHIVPICCFCCRPGLPHFPWCCATPIIRGPLVLCTPILVHRLLLLLAIEFIGVAPEEGIHHNLPLL